MKIWWLLIHVVSLELVTCLRNAYTSVESIKKILELDKEVDSLLRSHLVHLDDHKDLILQYITEWESMDAGMGDEKGNVANNPLNAFQAIRRLTVDIFKIEQRLRNINNDFEEALARLQLDDEQTINYQDLTGAITGILRLQDTYFLAAEDLANGTLHNISTSTKLTSGDCLLLAEGAKEIDRLDFYVEWREQAHTICQRNSRNCSATTEHLYMSAVLEHDNVRETYARELKKNNTFPMEKIVFKKGVYNLKASIQRKSLNLTRLEKHPRNPKRLCSLGLTTTNSPQPLSCHYLKHPNNPYATLHRFKVEVQYLNPLITTIYDVITHDEAKLFIELASPRLSRSQVKLKNTTDLNKGMIDDQRISETAWISDFHDSRIRRISKRIQHITGLSTSDNDAEPFQVVNYGIGGQYSPHYDFLLSADQVQLLVNDTDFNGNRVVTFILYLSDVDEGGATIFPKCQVAVHPLRGSATMWYNLNTSGIPDYETLHGGCPVLYGSKWIANKWILERGQLFRRPCPSNQQIS